MAEFASAPLSFTCLLCHGHRGKTIHRRQSWQYLRCRNCGLVHLHPRPDAVKAMAAYNGYLSRQPDEIARWQWMMQPVVTKSADLIESRQKGRRGRLLDMGCGYDFSPHTMAQLLKKCRFTHIETVIGGYTRPAHRVARWCSIFTGELGERIQRFSCGRLLLPGLSKTTLARKPE